MVSQVNAQSINVLADSYPEIAEKISRTKYDPFYLDSRIPLFLARLLTEFVEMDE